MSQKLSNYTIQEEIGRGGMATVYKAVQESLNRIVALKELDLFRLRSEANALERFRLEARAAAALKHPNIVTIYDLWEEADKAYIAMEFIDGVELKDVLLNLGSIEYMSAVSITLAVSEALHYAHTKGMVHRDVKPGNIMLSGSGDIRLMDFGIVSVSGNAELTVAGQILGTPAYMPPEQIAGEKLGPGADIFSLGAVLYEMIAGVKPFKASNHVALIQAVLHEHPTPLHELNPQVPESISGAVQKCLEKKTENRFSSMEEFSTVIEMVMSLERPDSKKVVKRLVENTKEHERTRLHSNFGESDRTSPQSVAHVELETAADDTKPSSGKATDPPSVDKKDELLIQDSGGDLYGLEDGPPIDLPPLEPEDERKEDFVIEGPAEKPAPTAISFVEPPVQETLSEETPVVVKPPKPSKKRHYLWLVPIIIILAVGVWRFYGGPKPAAIVKKAINPTMKAKVTVVARPGGRVFMDGELMGNARPTLNFDVKPGLHHLQVRLPRHEPKKFILDLEPGENKKIEVIFGQQK